MRNTCTLSVCSSYTFSEGFRNRDIHIAERYELFDNLCVSSSGSRDRELLCFFIVRSNVLQLIKIAVEDGYRVGARCKRVI